MIPAVLTETQNEGEQLDSVHDAAATSSQDVEQEMLDVEDDQIISGSEEIMIGGSTAADGVGEVTEQSSEGVPRAINSESEGNEIVVQAVDNQSSQQDLEGEEEDFVDEEEYYDEEDYDEEEGEQDDMDQEELSMPPAKKQKVFLIFGFCWNQKILFVPFISKAWV